MISIKKVILKIIKHIVVIDKKLILFESYDDFCEGTYAFYCYLRQKGIKHKIIWLISKSNVDYAKKEKIRYSIYDSKSMVNKVKTYYYSLRCKYYLYSHRYLLPYDNPKRICIFFMHGQPFKWTGRYFKTRINNSYVLINNAFTASIMENEYGVDKEKMIVTVNPRVMPLIDGIGKKKEDYILGVFCVPENAKIIVSLTTWSKKAKNVNYSTILPLTYTNNDLTSLNTFLKSKGYYLVVKLHPMDTSVAINKYSNIFIVDKTFLTNNQIDLYELLYLADAIMTDYSSVFIDFYLKEKPIYFFKKSIELEKDKYIKDGNGGFVFKNPEKYMAGRFIGVFDDLYNIDIETDEKMFKSLLMEQNMLWNGVVEDLNPNEKLLEFIKTH